MTILYLTNKVFALGVIGSQIVMALLLIYVFLFQKRKHTIVDIISKHGILLAFLVALFSTLGSLFYSQIAGFEPCDLCWFQRIFMYPGVVLLGLALLKKDSRIVDYMLSLSVIGFLISLYHNYIYYGGNGSSCQVFGRGVSCVKRYVFEFGYVTIPMMAATSFLLVIVCLLLHKAYRKKSAT